MACNILGKFFIAPICFGLTTTGVVSGGVGLHLIDLPDPNEIVLFSKVGTPKDVLSNVQSRMLTNPTSDLDSGAALLGVFPYVCQVLSAIFLHPDF